MPRGCPGNPKEKDPKGFFDRLTIMPAGAGTVQQEGSPEPLGCMCWNNPAVEMRIRQPRAPYLENIQVL